MMKKVLCLALVGSLMCAVGANAQTTVELELVSDTSGEYYIEATITGGDLSEGLALWGADVNFTAGGPPGQMSCPVAMSSFQVNDGLNNPAGYGGTLSGNILLQVGGAQNTINNDVGNAPYPIGAVVTGIGATTITVAEGTCVDTVDEMTLENGFANVINDGETGPVYAVSAATVTVIGTYPVVCGGLDPYACPGLPSTALCPDADVDCNNITDGLDIAVIRSTANWGLAAPGVAVEARADVDRNGIVDGLDIAFIRSTACWQQ